MILTYLLEQLLDIDWITFYQFICTASNFKVKRMFKQHKDQFDYFFHKRDKRLTKLHQSQMEKKKEKLKKLAKEFEEMERKKDCRIQELLGKTLSHLNLQNLTLFLHSKF
jgi:hypothetical protein